MRVQETIYKLSCRRLAVGAECMRHPVRLQPKSTQTAWVRKRTCLHGYRQNYGLLSIIASCHRIRQRVVDCIKNKSLVLDKEPPISIQSIMRDFDEHQALVRAFVIR